MEVIGCRVVCSDCRFPEVIMVGLCGLKCKTGLPSRSYRGESIAWHPLAFGAYLLFWRVALRHSDLCFPCNVSCLLHMRTLVITLVPLR